jgi:hypothetical protein
MPDLLEQGSAVRRRSLLERRHDGRHPAVQVGAVVGVADRGVELGQLVPVLLDEPGELADPAAQRRHVDRRTHA